jgi:hypothetical protein
MIARYSQPVALATKLYWVGALTSRRVPHPLDFL